ncbi:MAG: 3' terminal RNA ribose 2'-O-methyltransferase Hen1 [Chloroflexi bacterium]|nr:3' terminal RNA ribose 2'-O-methyltransferase Hen1 [Chloroflexota bacterium]
MLLTISAGYTPATDLGYLVQKNPGRFQSFALPFGRAHVFYPEATADRCTVALALDVDPIGLVRGKPGAGEAQALEQYVNDRPYVASSYLSVAIAAVFGSALAGRSKERPHLVEQAVPLEAELPVVPSSEGAQLVRTLFEPLGYDVKVQPITLDTRFPEWGLSRYAGVRLQRTGRLKDLLAHLYVLIPVLDDNKHYWVGDEEVAKLVRFGEGWLATHPSRELISQRYLKHQRSLVLQALARLLEADEAEAGDSAVRPPSAEEQMEAPLRLADLRIEAVLAELRALGAQRVLDLGCGEGRLIRALLDDPAFRAITGLDVAHRRLEVAAGRLHLERMPAAQKERVQLLHGSLTYRDKRLAGYDAAVAIEVIEHIDASRLDAFEEALFGAARPGAILITTPNVEYNRLFPSLPAGSRRHPDHRFEWTRAEFQTWGQAVAARRGYNVRFLPVGLEDARLGAPTQMGVFTR